MAALVSPVLFSTPAAAQVEPVGIEFRTALQPYGTFRQVARWGEVWVPNVAPDWRPYTIGRWVYSDDYGWYWVSAAPEAPWGWVAFHYGRWVWIDDIGWAWVPGTQWGPAWVGWRRGGGYIGWAPLPPQDLVVEIRDEPQYWIFCQHGDFLATSIATVFIQPQPVFFRETVVVNETILVRGHGFAVNPGIQPAYIAAFIGRPVPEYEVRPHVLAGTVSLPNAIEVTGEDLRSGDFRRDLVRQTNIRQSGNTVEPARNLSPPQPLGRNEQGRLGDNPPRAASGFAQQSPRQPGAVGEGQPGQRGLNEQGARGTPELQRNFRERGATGQMPPQQRRELNQRGATGQMPPQQQRELNQRGATNPQQQRGFTERGANEPGQQRRLYDQGETGLPSRNEGGLRGQGTNEATPEPRGFQQQRGAGSQQRGFREGGGNGAGLNQQRQLFDRGDAGQRERGATGPTMGPSSGQQRQLFNRAPGSSMPGPQQGPGGRGPSGPARPIGPGAGAGAGPAAGPGSGGGGQQRGFERRH